MNFEIPCKPDLAGVRSAHLARFMSTQSFSIFEIDERARKLCPSARELLFVSSIVHGLGGSTSDIDVIVTLAQEAPTDMMTNHMFLGGRRVGVTVYAEAQMQRALAQMDELAVRELPSLLRAWRALVKAEHAVPEQELERAVNGVSVHATMPLSMHLPSLSSVWTARSFDEFRQGVVCALLSERAGELRAPRGYLSYALRYLMDAVLSHSGDVYSNDKWFLLRWERAQREQRVPSIPLTEHINELWHLLRGGALDLQTTTHAESLQSLLSAAAAQFGYTEWSGIALPAYAMAGERGRLVANAVLWLGAAGESHFLSDESVSGATDALTISDLSALTPREASAFLNVLRSGRATCSLEQLR